jgi:hypothetical protein
VDEEIKVGDSRSGRKHRRSRLRARLLGIAVVPTSLALFAPSALAAKNVNFIGTWKVSSGTGFTITKENRKTGVCAGRSSLLKSGYKLVACRVHANRYSFTITYGPSYKSRNAGTISGNKLKGRFRDTNGTVESYTATRHH